MKPEQLFNHLHKSLNYRNFLKISIRNKLLLPFSFFLFSVRFGDHIARLGTHTNGQMINDPYPFEIVFISNMQSLFKEGIQTYYNVPTIVGFAEKSGNSLLVQTQLHKFAHSLGIEHGIATPYNGKKNFDLLLATPYDVNDLATVLQAVEEQTTTDTENHIHWFKKTNVFHFSNLFDCAHCMFNFAL